MENKKGSGIFLGVVAVATLVVAIIGATFAYFSISAQSNEDAVNVTAYEFNASLVVNNLYPASGATFKGLIPLDADATVANVQGTNNKNLLYAINEATNKCIDSLGYLVCQVVELSFTNGGSDPMTLNGTLTTKVNTAASRTGASEFTDLKMRIASGILGENGAPNTLTFDQTTGATPSTIIVNVPQTVDDTASLGSVTIPGNTTVKKYYVVYLDGTDDTTTGTDQSDQMGATYQGMFTFGDAVSGNKLTGTFNVGGASPASSSAE